MKWFALVAAVLLVMPAVSHADNVIPGRPYRIKNAWGADQNGQRPDGYLNIEFGRFDSTPVQPGWQSAWWVLEPVKGTGFYRIRNVWKPDYYIHTESGAVDVSPIQLGWQSAWWELEPYGNTPFFRLRNGFRRDQYLHVQFGPPCSGPIEWGCLSAVWSFEPVN